MNKNTTPQALFENAVGQFKQNFSNQNFEGYAKAQQAQIEKTSVQLLKGYEDLKALTKGNADAMAEASATMIRGAEQVSWQVAAFAQASLEKSVATSKAAFTARSFRDLINLQNTYVRQSFEALVAETTKLQNLSVKVTNEALAPLSTRVNLTVGTLTKPLAA